LRPFEKQRAKRKRQKARHEKLLASCLLFFAHVKLFYFTLLLVILCRLF
jgi:hypothetical protein